MYTESYARVPTRSVGCACTSTRTRPAARARCSRRCSALTREQAASIRTTHGATAATRGTARRSRRPCAPDQRAGRGDSRRRVAALRGRSDIAPFEAIVVVPAFDMYAASARRPRADGWSTSRSGADFAFPLDELLAAITAGDADRVRDESAQSDRVLSVSREAILAIADAAAAALVFVDEAYADFAGETLIDDPAASIQTEPRRSAGRSPRRTASPPCAPARSSRAGTLRAGIRRVRPSLQPQHARPSRAAGGDRGYAPLRLVPAPGRASPRRCSTHAFDRLGLHVLAEARRTSCSRTSADRAATSSTDCETRGVYVRDRSGDLGCEGCIRITAGIVEHTQALHRSNRGGAVRRALIERDTTETSIRPEADARRARTLRRSHRHPVPRSHAGARRATRRVRPHASRPTGDLDVDQHHTVEDRRYRARARRCRPRSATRRGINRAGYFVMPMDETLAVAAIDLGGRIARGRRPEAAGEAVSATCRRSWSTISSTASRRAPGRTSTSRCCTAARAITRSKRSSRRSRARCGSPAHATGSWRACCRRPRDCCEVAPASTTAPAI